MPMEFYSKRPIYAAKVIFQNQFLNISIHLSGDSVLKYNGDQWGHVTLADITASTILEPHIKVKSL